MFDSGQIIADKWFGKPPEMFWLVATSLMSAMI